MKNIVLFFGFLLFAHVLNAGCISGNCIDGEGTYIDDFNNKYIGHFQDGMPNGNGIMYFANGDKYLGTWIRGQKHGKGKLIFSQKDIYIGHFAHDAIEGKGKMTYAKGDFYEGYWHNDMPHGEGEYKFKNGSIYKGEFYKGKFDGKGRFVNSSGGVMAGIWKNHKLIDKHNTTASPKPKPKIVHQKPNRKQNQNQNQFEHNKIKNCNSEFCHQEQGVYTYKDGSKYLGGFINGKPFGEGICNYISGNKYIGEWKDNAPHGKGIMHYTTGVVYGAHWENGKPLRLLDSKEKYDIAGDILVDKDDDVKIWAVVIGVSKYRHMPTLNYSDDDAYRLFAFLKSPEGGALPDQQIEVLIDEDATREKILETMQNTFYKADDNDMVILYFSGHGLKGNFLPIDYDGYNNKIRHEEIKDIFARSKAKYKVCYADACYSGSMTAMKSVDINEQLDHYYTELNKANEGVAFMLSSKAEEYSLEDGGLRQGVFSHFLIRGLKGEANRDQNRLVTINELYKYVNFEVRKYTGNVQNPTITGKYDNDMPVSIIRR